MPSTTRKPIPRKYEKCKTCPNDISSYGKCKIKFVTSITAEERTIIVAIVKKRFGNGYWDFSRDS